MTIQADLSKEVMLADLTLRGWIVQADYLYMRLTDQTVRVCMESVAKTQYYLTTIPFSLKEEDPTETQWAGTEVQLRAAYVTICSEPRVEVTGDQPWLAARVKMVGKAAVMAQAYGGTMRTRS